MTNIRITWIPTMCLSFLAVAASSDASNGVRTVALTGKPAPGSASPFIDFINRASINGDGDAAFFAEADSIGLWAETGGGGLRSIVQVGDPAPGISGYVVFSALDASNVHLSNNADFIAFEALVSGDGIDSSNDEGIWLSKPAGGLELLVREGQPLPGDPNSVFEGGFGVVVYSMNDVGQPAFWSANPTGDGIWTSVAGVPQAIAREGEMASFLLAGATFDDIPAIQGALNILGQTAFEVRLSNPNGGRPEPAIVVAGIDGSGRIVAQHGDVAPDPNNAGVTFRIFFEPVLNASGETAFIAATTGGLGIWSEGGGTGLRSVARIGDPVPGDPNATIEIPNPGTLKQVVLNNAGETAFLGDIFTPGVGTSGAVFKENGIGNLEVVARVGETAPGTALDFVAFFEDVAFNIYGQTAFFGEISGGDSGIWAEDDMGNLRLIVRTGEMLDVSNDPFNIDLREVVSLDFLTKSFGSANATGGPSGFSDQGRVAFRAAFSDGSSGVFVSSLVAIPEPTGFALLLMGSSILLGFQRHRRHHCPSYGTRFR